MFLRSEDKRLKKCPADDVHHIFHAGKCRMDVESNLICLSRQIHSMDATYGKELRVLCLWLKLQKGELDVGEINRAAGAVRPDAQPVLVWLESKTMCHEAFEPLRLELINYFSVD